MPLSKWNELELCGRGLKGKREYRRFQSVWLCLKHGKTQQEVANLLNLHVRTVRKHNERYRLEGLSAFLPRVPGPKAPRYMSQEHEAQLLSGLQEQARQGVWVAATLLRQAYEAAAGRPVARSTLYLVLHRQGWSKKRPRPRHPQADVEAQEDFKKTGVTDSRDCYNC